jgi:hypothetical protein
MDATGLESTPSSAYYQTRRGQRRKGYVQVSLLILCGSLLPCGVEIGRGPCNDKSIARHLLAKASAQVRPQPLVADAGYDAECVHELCRERWRVSSWIPLAVRSRNGQVQSHRWRPGSMTHVPRWQRLAERPSAITACGFGQPGTPLAASRRNGQVQSHRWRAWSMTHVPRWQRLVGKAKCNHRLRPTRHPAGSVSSEWPSAIPPLEGVVNDPCSEVAASGRNGRVRGRWRSQRREMPRVYRSRWHVESFLSGLKRTTGLQLTAWR